jgi:outer membrane protein OmpA-like peptidoglycan-associated protein
MRRLLFLFILLPFWSAAQNLLVNGGFEEENICTEYRVNCAPEGWIYTVPSFIYYFKEPVNAHTGQSFVALVAGHARKSYFRTFVRSRLLCQLRQGHQYRLEFFVKSRHPIIDSVGVYFGPDDFLFEKRRYQDIRPSVFLSAALQKPSNRDTQWQKIVINYTAKGDEAFITLGMFGKRDYTGPTGIERENNYFVLFDDISLFPLDKNEVLCRDWKQNREEIYAQNERHEHQLRLMKFFRTNPPRIVPPKPTIVLKIDTLIVPDVFFATNSFVLNKNAVRLLDSFRHRMRMLDIDSVVVVGHTDATGTDQWNRELSWRRANSVGAYLQEASPVNIVTRGLGSEKPVADNRSARGRQMNRRVEIFIYKKNE